MKSLANSIGHNRPNFAFLIYPIYVECEVWVAMNGEKINSWRDIVQSLPERDGYGPSME